MPPFLILVIAVLSLVAPYLGVWALLRCAPYQIRPEQTEIIKVVLTASLAVCSASFIWLLSFWQKVKETKKANAEKLAESEKSKRNFRQALWTEIGSLYGTAFDEAQWWKKEMKDKRIGVTEKRLVPHFQAVILNANLSRITDVKPEVADALIELRANLLILPEKIEFFYGVEDKLIEEVKAKQMTEARAVEILTVNKLKIFESLMRLAGRGRRGCLLLDPDGAFEAEREKSFTKEVWAKRKESDDAMNEILDKRNKHVEECDSFSL